MNIDKSLLDQLYETAKDSFDKEEIPVSAIIINSKSNIIVSIAGNNRQGNNNVLGHAEINSILDAEAKIGDWRLDGYYMIVTLEPCDMCSMVIKESRLDNVYYFLPRNQSSSYNILNNKHQIEGYEEYKEKFNDLLTKFFNNMR